MLIIPLFGLAVSAAAQVVPERAPLPFSSPPASVSPQPAPASTGGPLETVKGMLTGSPAEPELLPPDEAYKLNIRAQAADTLVATLTPADGYYLYRDRIKFVVEDPPGVSVASVLLPSGDIKEDPT
ncbi:MAG: protein-disulfide reductase DsbD N-terminal domain-containing protein, partial [Pseudomonadota bacterium]|nr:protein-disulfide reductase DsbD N-terminal domain-containing protein [Pseudomonadota bacterium]